MSSRGRGLPHDNDPVVTFAITAMREHEAARVVPSQTRRHRSGKAVCLRMALQSGLLATLFVAPAHALDATTSVSPQDVQAKIAYCEVCHGPSARGFVGYYPIPRLAGQQVAYIENQLRGFIDRKRTNPIMANVAHTLSPAMLTALAAKLHDLNPKPVGGAPADRVAAGEKIYKEGIPSASVPACAGCHGAEARGNDQFPRLAGQLYPYVVLQLKNWSTERAEDLSAIMAPIAHNLNKSQIEEVAAYVSGLD
jgi:cytochrome c553